MNHLTIMQRRPGVTQVTMARPEVFNAFDEAMIAELHTAFTALAADTRVRTMVPAKRIP